MINPSPYVLISAILLQIISTDLPTTLLPATPGVVRFNRLCASSNTVICLNPEFA